MQQQLGILGTISALIEILCSWCTKFQHSYFLIQPIDTILSHFNQVHVRIIISFFHSCGAAAQRGLWARHSRGFQITYNDAPQSVGLLWTSYQIVAETSTWQHTTLKRNRHPCPRRDSNPQYQQASGRRPTPQTARPLGPAIIKSGRNKC